MAIDVVVIGSLNMDLVANVPRYPQAGETLRGSRFRLFPGGKGANQAVAAARLGASVAMVGRVGDDPFGPAVRDSLRSSGVDTTHVQTDPAAATGVGIIAVDPAGQNHIIIVSGANDRVDEEDLRGAADLLAGARLLLLQFEIPMPIIEQAARQAHESGILVFLNPAPSAPCPPDLLSLVDCIVPNELEAQAFTGVTITDVATAERAAERLLELGIPRAIITLGERGCVCASQEGVWHEPALAVKAVDTTAAGDAFIGGLAAAWVRGKPMREAVRFATCAAGLSVTRAGAQASLPDESEVRAAYQTACGSDP
jgi:ribokinase